MIQESGTFEGILCQRTPNGGTFLSCVELFFLILPLVCILQPPDLRELYGQSQYKTPHPFNSDVYKSESFKVVYNSQTELCVTAVVNHLVSMKSVCFNAEGSGLFTATKGWSFSVRLLFQQYSSVYLING